jgi:hypothetical protein
MKFKSLISIIAALSIASIAIASVAGAATKSPNKRSHVRPPATSIDSPEGRYRNDPYAVWVAGTYVGRDPDPNVRAALIREFYHNMDSR